MKPDMKQHPATGGSLPRVVGRRSAANVVTGGMTLPNSTHQVVIELHRSVRTWRSSLNARRWPVPSGSGAICKLQPFNVEHPVVATIAIPLEYWNEQVVTHEAVHAAVYRCQIMGLPGTQEHEEELATGAGHISQGIWDLFRQMLAHPRRPKWLKSPNRDYPTSG